MYRRLGFASLQYILPTRFIFRHSDQVHEALEDVASYLGQRGASTPLIIHCLSDTGCMSFQVNILRFFEDLKLSSAGTDNSLWPPRHPPEPPGPGVGQLPGPEAARDHPPGPRPLRHQLAVEAQWSELTQPQ